MEDIQWDLAIEMVPTEVEMGQIAELGKPRRDWGLVKAINREIKSLQAPKLEETLEIEQTINLEYRKFEANDMTGERIASDSFPRTTIWIICIPWWEIGGAVAEVKATL